jgi:hypothetical protein
MKVTVAFPTHQSQSDCLGRVGERTDPVSETVQKARRQPPQQILNPTQQRDPE